MELSVSPVSIALTMAETRVTDRRALVGVAQSRRVYLQLSVWMDLAFQDVPIATVAVKMMCASLQLLPDFAGLPALNV